MTSRSPFIPEFTRKVTELYNCVEKYYRISDEKKLQNDLSRPDLDLVCFYELNELRKSVRANPWGVHYHDIIKLQPADEREYVAKLEKAHHL